MINYSISLMCLVLASILFENLKICAMNPAALHAAHGAHWFLQQQKKRERNENLLKAAEKGDVAWVTSLVNDGADINHADYKNNSPLLLAAKYGHQAVVAALLSTKKIKNVDHTDQNGYTALIWGAEVGNADIAKLLVAHGANANKLYKNGSTTPVSLALEKNNDALFEALTGRKPPAASVPKKTPKPTSQPVPIPQQNKDPKLQLLEGAASNDRVLVRSLLQQGIDSNCVDSEGNTALILAAKNRHKDMVALLLLHKGTTVDQANTNFGDTALSWAAFRGDTDIVNLLISHGADVNKAGKQDITPLSLAARTGHVAVVRLLLQHHAHVNDADDRGNTPFSLAIASGEADVVELLIRHGADVHKAGKDGLTPLALAVRKGSREIIKLLAEHGADVNCAYNGITPLRVIVDKASEELTQKIAQDYISKHGKTLIATTVFGKDARVLLSTPFILNKHIPADVLAKLRSEVLKKHEELIKLLLKYGADSNYVAPDMYTPLTLATGEGWLEIVKLFLEHGAHAIAVKKGLGDALFWAVTDGHEDIALELLHYGAPINPNVEEKLRGMLENKKYSDLALSVLFGQSKRVSALLRQMPPAVLEEHRMRQCGKAPSLWQKARSAFNNYPDINTRDEFGMTVLHVAALRGDIDLIKKLLDFGADWRLHTGDGMTAHDIVKKSKDKAFAQGNVVRAGVFERIMNYINYYGTNIQNIVKAKTAYEKLSVQEKAELSNKFLQVVQAGNAQGVLDIVQQGVDSNQVNDQGETPLMLAAAAGNKDVMHMLLNHGADINQQDSMGNTALMRVIGQKSFEIAHMLIEHSADSSVTNNEGQTALTQALCTGNQDLLELLVKNGAVLDPVQSVQAIQADKYPIDTIIFLLRNGVSVTPELRAEITKRLEEKGMSQLSLAITSEDYSKLESLLCSIPQPVVTLNLARQHAAEEALQSMMQEFQQAVSSLQEPYIDINQQGADDGTTALHWAAAQGNIKAVQALLKHGAHQTLRDRCGLLPLEIAQRNMVTARTSGNAQTIARLQAVIQALNNHIQADVAQVRLEDLSLL